MDNHEKHAYLAAIRKRYRRAKRADKGTQIVLLQASCIHQETPSVPWFGGFDGVARRYFKSTPYDNR